MVNSGESSEILSADTDYFLLASNLELGEGNGIFMTFWRSDNDFVRHPGLICH